MDAAILEAALGQLDAVGYQGMSIASVAAVAGVGRPAVYRRFGSKAELVVAAIQRMASGEDPDLPDDPRAALAGLLGAARAAFGTPAGTAVLGSLLAEQARDPELLAAFRTRIFDPRRATVHRLVDRAAAADAVDPATDREALDALLFGALLARAILGEPVDGPWVERVLDQAWRGMRPDPVAVARHEGRRGSRGTHPDTDAETGR